MAIIDFLTCGGCQAEFPLSNIVIFMEHKKLDCSVAASNTTVIAEYEFRNYTCYTCPKTFGAAVSLLQHAQYQHKQNIFRDESTAMRGPSSGRASWTPASFAHENDTPQQLDGRTRQSEGDELQLPRPSDAAVFSNDYSCELSEPLSKCCTSVIPKKRKRHFETKHRTSYFKAARLRRQQTIPSSDIYINVDQAPRDMNQSGVESHPTYLQTVTIPISAGNGAADYFGISYTDSLHSNGDYESPVAPSNTTTAAAPTSSPTEKPSNSNNNSPIVKKKYPTSKPFKCDHCEYSFNQRIHLKKHLSKHTGVKPFKCGQCDYATVERSHLKVHIRIHTGEKPFKCGHCEYSTAQNSTLKIHLKRHHGSVSLECTFCGKQFPEETQLLYHKQEHSQLVAAPAAVQDQRASMSVGSTTHS